MKVVIIGGGLLGLLSVRELALSGAQVVVVEQSEPGRESSWAGGGILSPLYPWQYAASVNALAKWSQAHYFDLCQELIGEGQMDPEWTPSGMLVLDMEMQQQAQTWAQDYGLQLDVLGKSQLNEVEPNLSPAYDAALFFPEIAQVRNPRLVKSMIASCRLHKVEFVTQTTVTGLITNTREQIVSGVETSKGRIDADQVVIAGGAWSKTILDDLGYDADLKVRPVRGQMLAFKTDPDFLKRITHVSSRYVIPRRDGHVLVGSTLEDVGFDKSTTDEARDELIDFACDLIPGLANYPVAHHWSGLRPATPEGIPYISKVPERQGLWVNSGHFRNGVVMGLASARLLVDMLLDRPKILDSAAYELKNG